MMTLRTLVLAAAMAAALAGSPAVSQEVARLDPNTATAAELAVVPGLAPALAAAIEAERPFATIVEFDALVREQLSAEEAQALYEQVFVPVNLNTASEAEIALIPGMSGRMVHEFLEYRPYADLDTFDREIGKYVDEAEVARLRSYVAL